MPEHCTATTARKTVRAQIVFSNELPPDCPPFELPDGRMMMEVELEGITLLIVRPGSIDRVLLEELNQYAERVTTLGIWSRDPNRTGISVALPGFASR